MIILVYLRSGMKDFWRWVLRKCSRYNSFIQVWIYMSLYEMTLNQGCRFLLSIVGDNLQFYSNFALFSTLGGWTSTTIFFRWANQVKTKKRSSPKMEHFFPRIQVETCAQMHTGVKFLEGMQRKTTLKLLGEIYPHPVSAPLLRTMLV